MQIGSLHGQPLPAEFCLYAASDSAYFDQFAVSFFRSAHINADIPVHLHLYNPRSDQLALCARHGVSASWETVDSTQFYTAANGINQSPNDGLRRTQSAMAKGGDQSVLDRLIKTYYACARFIRLAELVSAPVFAVDIDAVIRGPLPKLQDQDLWIHHVDGRDPRFLAGGIWVNNLNFLKQYASALIQTLECDCVYWGMDQDVLNEIVPSWRHAQLPETLIDWNMRPSSAVWTAKGTRKDLSVFKQEQKKYYA